MNKEDFKESEVEVNGEKYKVYTSILKVKPSEIRFHIDPVVVKVGIFSFYIPSEKEK